MSKLRHPSRVGELVGGKYRVVRFLAEGGMGAVYEAFHTVVKRRFAVKFLHRDLARQREILARFQREAQAAGALESEHVTAAVDFGISADGSPYIIMEFLVGEDLRSLLKREQRLMPERAADLLVQACRGVQAAHEAGILHRDLKPENLFVCRREDGRDLLKVVDFGVAKLQDGDENNGATRSGAVLGTTSYLSPEQARGDAADERTDVYALGAILYELLSGQQAHPGTVQHAVLFHIATQPPAPLLSLQPELPGDLIDVVQRAMAFDRSERYASAEAFGLAVARTSQRGGAADGPGLARGNAPLFHHSPVALSASLPSPKPVRLSSVATWWFVGAVALALVFFAVYRRGPALPPLPAELVRAQEGVPSREPAGPLPASGAPVPEERPSPTPSAAVPPASAPSSLRLPVQSRELAGSTSASARQPLPVRAHPSEVNGALRPQLPFDQKNPYK